MLVAFLGFAGVPPSILLSLQEANNPIAPNVDTPTKISLLLKIFFFHFFLLIFFVTF